MEKGFDEAVFGLDQVEKGFQLFKRVYPIGFRWLRNRTFNLGKK
jgi:hypothetical protein